VISCRCPEARRFDPVHDRLPHPRRNTSPSAAIAKRAIVHLSRDDLSAAHAGITGSIFCPTKVVVARLAGLRKVSHQSLP
jgi:hypothetical protein